MLHNRPIGMWLVVASILFIIAFMAGDLILVREDRVIPIGYATTRIIGPLRSDGTVDYRLALDAIDFRGVTPANNAVLPLLHALGTGKNILGSTRNRRAALRRLGMQPLPKKGPYFVGAWTFYQSLIAEAKSPAQREALERRKDNWPPLALTHTPWIAIDHPRVAQWLALNRVAFHWAMVASGRSRYAMPVPAPGRISHNLLMFAIEPWLAIYRELAQGMAMQAMEYLGGRNIPASENTILAIHRLARLEGQDSSVISWLVALSVDANALRCEQALATRGNLTVGQIEAYQRTFCTLPAFPSFAAAVNLGQRFCALDALTSLARGQKVRNNESHARWTTLIPIDYTQIARWVNCWFDRTVKVFSHPTYQAQAEGIVVLKHDFAEAVADSHFSPTARLGALFEAFATTGNSGVVRLFGRHKAQRRISILAFALAVYHDDHGRYPTALKKLVPKFIKKLPNDPFTDKPLRYRCNGPGYILTSIGPRRQFGTGRHPITLRVQ